MSSHRKRILNYYLERTGEHRRSYKSTHKTVVILLYNWGVVETDFDKIAWGVRSECVLPDQQ